MATEILMGNYVSLLDTIYSEDSALAYAKELVAKNKEQEFLELAPMILVGSGKTTYYSRVYTALLYLKLNKEKNNGRNNNRTV